MGDLPTNIALVYDRVNKWGGAEEVLLALHHLFPAAPLYTSVYSASSAGWASVFPSVIPTFLQRIPLASTRHELFPVIIPLAFESLNLSQYQAVISVTSADAKGIITPPSVFHLCYCLTPTRYLWSHQQEYHRFLPSPLKNIVPPLFNYLKHWDQAASARPDSFVAISETVRDRISLYYQRDSTVVFPPVRVKDFHTEIPSIVPQDYFLYLGRLVPYKHPKTIIDTFNRLGQPLVVAGTGSQERYLKSIARDNIRFMGFVSQSQKVSLLQHCLAVIFFHEEDFGIVPVEAQAAGKPVIALNQGGARETILNGVTGILVEDADSSSLGQAVTNFNPAEFSSQTIRQHAQKFSVERFQQEFVKIFLSEWKKYKNIYTS